MDGVDKGIIRRPTIVNHPAIVVGAKHFLRHITPAAGANDIDGSHLGHKRPHPLQPPADLPAGFVRVDCVRASYDLLEALINRPGSLGRPQDDLSRSAPTDRDAEPFFQQSADAAIAQTVLVFHHGDHRLQIGPQLRGRRPDGVGGLQVVAWLDASTAWLASTDVNVEAANDRASWNLNLNLVIEVIFPHVTAAFVALLGQRCGTDFPVGRMTDWKVRPTEEGPPVQAVDDRP